MGSVKAVESTGTNHIVKCVNVGYLVSGLDIHQFVVGVNDVVVDVAKHVVKRVDTEEDRVKERLLIIVVA